MSEASMSAATERLFGVPCSWCGHEPHAEPCTQTIQTGSGKVPTIAPCPCEMRGDTPAWLIELLDEQTEGKK
jgi:hypothetical protein